MSIKYLINENSQFIWEIPDGKPNVEEPLTDPKDDQRSRVVQSAQKGNTCWYYALSRIRHHVGRDPIPAYTEDRKFEKLFSNYRKELSHGYDIMKRAIDCYYSIALDVHNQGSSYRPCDHSTLLKKYPIILDNPQDASEISLLISKFLNASSVLLEHRNASGSFKSFQEFMQKNHIENCCNITINFVENQLQITPVNLVKKIVDLTFKDSGASDEGIIAAISHILNGNGQSAFSLLHAGILRSCYEHYHLARSIWTPSEPIETLISELKTHGPLFAGGRLGIPSYNSSPFRLSKRLGNRGIWGWKPGSYNSGLMDKHTVVLIGAEVLTQQKNIYFIDPNDPSDPSDPSAQKIYKMSYDRFIEAITDSWNGDMQEIPPDEQGFLIYNENFTPPEHLTCPRINSDSPA